MTWLARYYDRRAAAGDGRDFLRQVGHTEGGRPISEAQFGTMLGRIRAALDLRPDDVLLDLCCGNGVFTRPLAGMVGRAVGVDFSPELIAVARAHHAAGNLRYGVQDARRLHELPEAEGSFTKVLMNAALQHFTPAEFEAQLAALRRLTAPDAAMLFAFVPDASRRAGFEAALRPGPGLRLRRLLGRDLLGTWWDRDQVTALCARLGLAAEFLAVDPSLDGARYRMDIRVRRA